MIDRYDLERFRDELDNDDISVQRIKEIELGVLGNISIIFAEFTSQALLVNGLIDAMSGGKITEDIAKSFNGHIATLRQACNSFDSYGTANNIDLKLHAKILFMARRKLAESNAPCIACQHFDKSLRGGY